MYYSIRNDPFYYHFTDLNTTYIIKSQIHLDATPSVLLQLPFHDESNIFKVDQLYAKKI